MEIVRPEFLEHTEFDSRNRERVFRVSFRAGMLHLAAPIALSVLYRPDDAPSSRATYLDILECCGHWDERKMGSGQAWSWFEEAQVFTYSTL